MRWPYWGQVKLFMGWRWGVTRLPGAGCDVVLSLGPWVSLWLFISPFMQQRCYFLGYLMRASSACAHRP